MKLKNLMTLMIIGCFPTLVQAAGYQLNEYSPAGMGRSFAGMGVVGDDYSAVAYNPAGMVYQEQNGSQLALSAVNVHSNFRGRSSPTSEYGTGNTNILRVLPSGFAQYHLNEDWMAGVGLYTPYGLATDYDNDWFGSTHGLLSEISVVDLSPAVSYRFNRYFSVGGAINFQYAKARLTAANSDIGGDDFGTGYTLGMTFTPIECFRMGISYRSHVKHTLKGDVDRLTTPYGTFYSGSVRANITTPETAILSLAWDVNPKWTLSGTARWTRWKRFDTLSIDISVPYIATTSSTEEDWRNTGFYALGADYHLNQKWTLRSGIGYDMTAIRDSMHRTPRIPDGRRFLASLGCSYAYDNLQFDFGASHIFIWGGNARGTDNVNWAKGNHPNIKYSSFADMVSFGVQYKF